jgi:uncharacterized protein YkwD
MGPTLLPAPSSISGGGHIVLVGNGNGEFGSDLNRVRENRDRTRVRTSSSLERAAQEYARTLSRQNYFSHTGPDGSDAMDRAKAADCGCFAVAENLAKGQRNTDQVFDAWMDSPDHRDNMLGSNYDSFGLGHAGDVWVLMLSD